MMYFHLLTRYELVYLFCYYVDTTLIIISFVRLFVLFVPVLSASKAGFVRLKWPLNSEAKRPMLQSKFLCSFSTSQLAGHQICT